MPFREQHAAHFTTLHAIKRPHVMGVVATMLIIALAATAAFLVLTPWVQTAAGTGSVTALDPNDRVQEISTFVGGRIEEWYVQDGSRVAKGDPILRVTDPDPQLLERLAAERQQALAQIQAAQTAVETANIDLDRYEDLYEDGLASRREVDQARIRIEDLRSRQAEANAALARLDVQISRQSAQLVRAPRDGLILSVNAGDSSTIIASGSPVATFLPTDAERAVELFINGRDVALITPGDKVTLEFEGWPAVQFSGWPSIAIGTFPGRVISIDPAGQLSGQFRVLVGEDPEAEQRWPNDDFVRIGAAVRGWVLLETVPVGYEIWRQLNDFPPQFPGEPPTASSGWSGSPASNGNGSGSGGSR